MRAPVAIVLIFGLGCAPSSDDTGAVLPDDETPPVDTGEPWTWSDTGAAGPTDEAPLHTVTLHQWGSWTLAPSGAWTSLVGELRVQEYVDGLRPPDEGDTDAEPVELACDVVFQLSGVPAETACATCLATFEVEHALLSGDPSGCHDPDLPAHESTWTLALEDEAVLKGHAGLWLPWYPATVAGDAVTFDWEATVGLSVEEEEME